MKTYKWFRGLLKASAFATVMFVMQACYGAPQMREEPFIDEEEANWQATDSIETLDQEVPKELEAE
jgi:hypothetical protein